MPLQMIRKAEAKRRNVIISKEKEAEIESWVQNKGSKAYAEYYRMALEEALKSRQSVLALPFRYEKGRDKHTVLAETIRTIREFLQQEEMQVYLVMEDEASAMPEKVRAQIEDYLKNTYQSPSFCERMPLTNMEPCCFSTRVERQSEEQALDDVLSQVGETFSEHLLRLIDEKGRTDVEVYKKANLDRKHFSKIRSRKEYQPTKKTALALAIALELSIEETRQLLEHAGFALSPGNKADLIVEYFISRGIYDIDTINLALFEYHQPLLAG